MIYVLIDMPGLKLVALDGRVFNLFVIGVAIFVYTSFLLLFGRPRRVRRRDVVPRWAVVLVGSGWAHHGHGPASGRRCQTDPALTVSVGSQTFGSGEGDDLIDLAGREGEDAVGIRMVGEQPGDYLTDGPVGIDLGG